MTVADKKLTARRHFPTLYQLNTRVFLTQLSEKLKREVSLDDIPDSELDRLANQDFDYVWLLSVWQTGKAGQEVSRTNKTWRKSFENTLTDLSDKDIAGSGFAITDYRVHSALGGREALKRLREKLRKRGQKLFLDFVPNHTALDHSWVAEHPEFYVTGTAQDLACSPQNFTEVTSKGKKLILAHGRDPYFDGWPDTLQLNYANPALQEAMMQELLEIAGQCDGVRCDMAMLIVPEIFQRTWEMQAESFWPQAIKRVKEKYPNFCFMAEVYWDMEWNLQEQGFDYTYDKRLYDRLRAGQARQVREHLFAELGYQSKMARFLENHDEPRAAATFSVEMHKAAAILTYLSPGLRLFHQGQFEGKEKHISPHLVRGPLEPINDDLHNFYQRLTALLQAPVFHYGQWQLLQCCPAWEDNSTWDNYICFAWRDDAGEHKLVTINYAPYQSQCYVPLPFPEISDGLFQLHDELSGVSYLREGIQLHSPGLYLDLPAWHYHVFRLMQSGQQQKNAQKHGIRS